MNCSTPGLPVHHQLPEFTQTHVHRVSDASSHLILCRPLLLLPPIPPSIRVFSNESTLCMRGPKYWSFSFSIIPSKEIQLPLREASEAKWGGGSRHGQKHHQNMNKLCSLWKPSASPRVKVSYQTYGKWPNFPNLKWSIWEWRIRNFPKLKWNLRWSIRV